MSYKIKCDVLNHHMPGGDLIEFFPLIKWLEIIPLWNEFGIRWLEINPQWLISLPCLKQYFASLSPPEAILKEINFNHVSLGGL